MGSNRLADGQRELSQNLIARRVAGLVVDALEVVDVEIGDAERAARAARTRAFDLEGSLECTSIEGPVRPSARASASSAR
jgi:hypothetical protein